MVRKTKEDAEQTRHLILDTAAAVFHNKGVSRTTLADIAEAAGLTRGAIYWHFKNKVDLFMAMCDRVTLPLETTRDQQEANLEADPIGFLRELSLHGLHAIVNDSDTRVVFDVMFHKCEFTDDMTPVSDRKSECINEYICKIEMAFVRAQAKGLLRDGVDPKLAAVGLHAYVSGLMAHWLREPQSLPLAQKAEVLVDQFLQGVLKTLD